MSSFVLLALGAALCIQQAGAAPTQSDEARRSLNMKEDAKPWYWLPREGPSKQKADEGSCRASSIPMLVINLGKRTERLSGFLTSQPKAITRNPTCRVDGINGSALPNALPASVIAPADWIEARARTEVQGGGGGALDLSKPTHAPAMAPAHVQQANSRSRSRSHALSCGALRRVDFASTPPLTAAMTAAGRRVDGGHGTDQGRCRPGAGACARLAARCAHGLARRDDRGG